MDAGQVEWDVDERPGWRLSVYEAAGEASGIWHQPGFRSLGRRSGEGGDPDRSAREAARRARTKVRRYCAANRLNRLGTLTYGGEGCHDPLALRQDVAGFFKELRGRLGGEPFPYLWTAEWHKSGHGLHVHFAVGRYVKRSHIDEAWGRGFVHIKLLGDLPVGSGPRAEARRAANYLAKYVGKDFDHERMPGLHRYEVAQQFQPVATPLYAPRRADALDAACKVMGDRPERVWLSSDNEGWKGPPAVWASWA